MAARWVSGGEVVCVSLPSHETGASVSVDLEFGDAASLAGVASLYSLSPSDGAVSDGSLALTSNEPMQERSIVVNASLLGDRVHFEASFDLFIAGDKNVGEGVSVCGGDLPEAPFGELGIGEGLIVRLLTASCLLYTSPSPRDKRQSRMPSSA